MRPLHQIVEVITLSISMHPTPRSIKLHLLRCIETAKLMEEPKKAEPWEDQCLFIRHHMVFNHCLTNYYSSSRRCLPIFNHQCKLLLENICQSNLWEPNRTAEWCLIKRCPCLRKICNSPELELRYLNLWTLKVSNKDNSSSMGNKCHLNHQASYTNYLPSSNLFKPHLVA